MTYFKPMTDFEIVKEIDLVLEGRGMRVDVSAYGPPLEEIMSKEAIELWKSLDCEGEDNISKIQAVTSSDAPKSVKDELINFFLGCRKDMAEDKVYAYKTIAEWWMEYKSEDSGCNAEEVKTPVLVDITASSVKELADATGKSVKKAIKPGKGTANERYKLKDDFKRIWDKYSESAALKENLNHKPSHRDVFNYFPAHKEISELRENPPVTYEEFHRALGAYSDRKHRKSPATRKKPR